MLNRTFQGAGLNINCVDYGGEGRPPLLFIHGGSAFGHWWDFVAPAFVDRFHTFAMDLRGHGQSDHSQAGNYAIEDYTADVAAIIESWALGAPILVGHSRGGLVALACAAAHRDKVHALAIVDSPAFISEEILLAFAQSVKDWRPRRYATLEEACAAFRLLPRETHATPAMLRQVARFAYRQEDDGAWVVRIDPRCRGREPFNAFDYLSKVACPTLIVKAQLSPLLDREQAGQMTAALRDGRMAEIEGAYHHVMLDKPAALVGVLNDFLAATQKTAPSPRR